MANEKKYASLETLITFLNNIKSKFALKTELDEIKEAKADWGQNDSTQIDYIKNRTHYVDKAFEDISWNGASGGETFVDTKYKYTYTKISNHVLTSADVNASTITMTSSGTTYTPYASTISQEYTNMYYFNKVFSISSKYIYVFIITGKAGTYDLCTIPSDGTYAKVYMPNALDWSSFNIASSGTIKKLDEMFIPDSVFESIDAKADSEHTHSFNDLDDKPFGDAGATQIMSWNGKTSGLSGVAIDGTVWYRIGNYFNPQTLIGAKATMSNGTVIEFTTNNMVIKDDGYCKTQYIRLVPKSNYQADVYEHFDAAGLYHIEPAAWGYYTKEITKDIVNTLNEKYIPDTIARTIDLDIAMEEVESSLSEKADAEHNHDDRYYTEAEIDAKLDEIDVNLDGRTSFSALTTAEYTTLERNGEINANTLYMLTDSEDDENNDELITVEDIDNICGTSIQYVDLNSEVAF